MQLPPDPSEIPVNPPVGAFLHELAQSGAIATILRVAEAETIERCRFFIAPTRITAGSGFGDLMSHDTFGHYTTSDLMIYKFDDATVIGSDALISFRSSILRDCVRHIMNWEDGSVVAEFNQLDRITLKYPISVRAGTAASVFMGYTASWRNYAHWMKECMPKLVAFTAARAMLPYVRCAVPDFAEGSFQEQTLRILGISEDEIVRVPHGTALHFAHVYLMSYLDIWSLAPYIRRSALALRAAALGDSPQSKTTSRLFIERRSPTRRVRNRVELDPILSRSDFETVRFEDMPLVEQIRCMASARSVIAEHGAGLANILFCDPGTKIVELFNPACVQPAFWSAASISGLEFGFLIGRHFATAEKPEPEWNSDYEIDTSELSEAISAMTAADLTECPMQAEDLETTAMAFDTPSWMIDHETDLSGPALSSTSSSPAVLVLTGDEMRDSLLDTIDVRFSRHHDRPDPDAARTSPQSALGWVLCTTSADTFETLAADERLIGASKRAANGVVISAPSGLGGFASGVRAANDEDTHEHAPHDQHRFTRSLRSALSSLFAAGIRLEIGTCSDACWSSVLDVARHRPDEIGDAMRTFARTVAERPAKEDMMPADRVWVWVRPPVTITTPPNDIRLYAVFHTVPPKSVHAAIVPISVGAAAGSATGAQLTDLPANAPPLSNARWSELSAIYKIWRDDIRSDFVGFCHYRRYFDFSGENRSGDRQTDLSFHDLQTRKNDLFDDVRIRRICHDGIIIARPHGLFRPIVEQYHEAHYINDLFSMYARIASVAPWLTPYIDQQFESTALHACNMFITNWRYFDELCRSWFPVLMDFDDAVPPILDNGYQARQIAFLSERLFDLWVRSKIAAGVSVHELPIFFVDRD